MFNKDAAKWVRSENWNERQKGRELEGGKYELKVPYSDPAELELEILRHGENVEVMAPAGLRARIAKRLAEAAKVYAGRA